MMIDEDTFFEPKEAKRITVPWTVFPVIMVLCLVLGFAGGYFARGRGGEKPEGTEGEPIIAGTTTQPPVTEHTTEPITEGPADHKVEIYFAPIYIVQNGTFADQRHLDNLIKELETAGYPAVTQELDRLTRVFSGAYLDRDQAQEQADWMQIKGFDTYIKNIDHLAGGNFTIEAADEQEYVLLTNIAGFVADLYRIMALETIDPNTIEVLPMIERTTSHRFDPIYNEIAGIYAVLQTEGYTSEQYRVDMAWRIMDLMIDINLTQ